MSVNETFFGGMEVATAFAVVLLGQFTVQMYVYYSNFPHDSKTIKTLIALVWVIEAAHVGVICYGLYNVTVTRYGRLDLPIPHEVLIAVVLGSTVHPLVQAIFTTRLFQLGRNKLNRALTAACWGLSGFILGATILLATKVFGASSIDAFEQEWSWLILGIFGATAMVDLVIGLAMGYYTARHVPPGMNTLDRLGLWAAQTGVLTSIVSTGVLVLFAVPRQTHLWLALLVVNTGMYGNSLMSLLNGRLHLAFQAEMPFSIMLSTVQHPVATVPAAHLKPQQGPLLSPLNFPSPLPKPSFMGYASPPPTALLFTPPSKNVQDIV